MGRTSLTCLLVLGVLHGLFGAHPAVAQATGDRCSSCMEQSRLLARLPCSAVTAPGWSLSSPFAVPAAALPPILQNWCLLTAPLGTPRPTLRTSLDLPLVSPQSSGFAPTIWPALHGRFLEQASALQGLPLEKADLAPVDVAIIDDAWNLAPGAPGDGYRRHGRTLGLTIRELACPDGQYDSCRLYLSHHRALRCDEGRSGTRVHLARAIYEAVVAWQKREHHRPSPANLIINLSVGFEDDGLLGSLLVQQAIEVATCHGALVIAAAGNTLPDGSGTGPLLPGGFESISVPASCNAHALSDPRGFVAAPQTRPLVRAASGVESREIWLPLLSTRPQGRAAIAAPGFQVTAGDPLTGLPLGPSDILTGTSVSAAVTSAVAALIWAYLPDLSPADVVSEIKTSSRPLGGLSDFGLPPHQHAAIGLIGACPALVAACTNWKSRACTEAKVSNLACQPADPEIRAWPSAVLDSTYFRGNIDTCVQPGTGSTITACNRMSRQDSIHSVCPDEPRVVGPQPGDLGCGACALKMASRTLYIAVDSTYKGDFIAKEVSIRRLDGVLEQPFKSLKLPTLRAGDKLRVLLELREPSSTIPAMGQAMLEIVSNTSEPHRFAAMEWW